MALMKRRSQWLRLLALLALPALALTARAQTVVVEPEQRWKLNQEIRYQRTRTRIDSRADKPVTARTPVTIKVIEARPTGYVISWRYGRTESAVASDAGEVAEKLLQKVDGFEYIVELDRSGEFKALRNWQEVRDKTLALFDQLLPASTASPAEQSAVAQIRNLFTTREGVSNFLLREVQLFFMLYGWRFEQGESETYDEQLPNPLGGPPLPAKATITAKKVDQQAAVLHYTLEFDRDKAGKILADSLAALAKRMNKPTDELATIATSLEVNDEAELSFDVRSRWPLKLWHERRAKVGDRSRTDRIDYEQQRQRTGSSAVTIGAPPTASTLNLAHRLSSPHRHPPRAQHR